MNDDFAPIDKVVNQGIADWQAERAAELNHLAQHASESRNPTELKARVADYIAELKAIDAANKAAEKPTPEEAALPSPRPGWLAMVLAVLRGLTW